MLKVSTLGYGRHENIAVKKAEEAYAILKNNKFHHVILYNSVTSKLNKEISKLYKLIKAENATITELDQQWLPIYPYYWDDIDGCLAVRCAEISMNTFEHNKGGIALFTGWNYSVLTHPEEKSQVDTKTFTTFNTIGIMV